MCHLRHRLRIFLFHRKVYVSFSRYSSFCVFKHPMIYKICYNIMMSIISCDRVHFWIHLLNRNLLSHGTRPINRCKLGQRFSGIFWIIWRTGAKFQVLFNLRICSNYSVTNYVKIPQCFIFWERWVMDI